MNQINMLEAKTHLSRLIAALEKGEEEEIVIARHGRPVARLSLYSADSAAPAMRRIGAARGAFVVPEDIDAPYGDLVRTFEDDGTESPK